MPRLLVTDRDGVERELNAPSGTSLMEPLRDMDDGVTAICGGMCSCATCHVYVDEAWVPKLPAAMSDEMDMLRRTSFSQLLSDDWEHGVEAAVDIALLGRYYERIADHAVSVGNRVVFVVTGQFPVSTEA